MRTRVSVPVAAEGGRLAHPVSNRMIPGGNKISRRRFMAKGRYKNMRRISMRGKKSEIIQMTNIPHCGVLFIWQGHRAAMTPSPRAASGNGTKAMHVSRWNLDDSSPAKYGSGGS